LGILQHGGGHSFDDPAAQPLTEFHHALLMAQQIKMTLFARRGQ
jgi:hypothetical protein